MFGPSLLARNIEASVRDALDAKPEVRASALRDLAKHIETDEERVVGGLVAALTDAEPSVRSVAARALGDIEAHGALDALVKAADDRTASVAEAAIEAIGLLASATCGKAAGRKRASASP